MTPRRCPLSGDIVAGPARGQEIPGLRRGRVTTAAAAQVGLAASSAGAPSGAVSTGLPGLSGPRNTHSNVA
jgi:hypothetical protein